MPKKRIILHQCFCRECEVVWYSDDVFSYCPFCAKKTVAKIMIAREETIKNPQENET